MTCDGSVFKLDTVAPADRSCSFHWVTDASPSLFPLNISSSLSSNSRRSFYQITDAPSFSQFFFLSYPSSNSCHSFIYPFHLSLSFSAIVQPMSLLHIPFSPFTFFLIHRSAYVTHYIPFSLSFSSIVQPMSLLPIPFSPFSFLLIVQPMSLLHLPFPPFSFLLRFIYPLHPSFPILSSYLLFDPRHSFIYPFHLFLGPPTSIPSSILKSTSRSCPLPPPFAHHGSLAAPCLVFRHLAFLLCPGGLHLFVRTTVYTQLHTYSMITTFSLPRHRKCLCLMTLRLYDLMTL